MKLVVFLAWVALIAVSVLMGSLYPSQLMGANPLLKVGFESICLVCAMYPVYGFLSSLPSDGAKKDGMVALLAFADYAVTVVGYFCLLLVPFGSYSSRLAGIWTCRPSNRRVPRSSADAGRLHITPAVGLYDEDIPF